MVRRSKFLISMVQIALILLAVGCATPGTKSPSTGTKDVPASQPSPPKEENVVVRSGVILTYFAAPVIIAQEAGFFEKHGVKVELVPFATGKTARDALVAKAIDISIIGFNPFVVTASKAQGDFVALGVGVYLGRGHSLVIRNGVNVKTPADLKGKRIGMYVGSSTYSVMVNQVLPEAGLKKGDYEVVNIDLPNLVSAMASGQIDAFAGSDPTPYQAEKAGVGKTLMDLGKWDPTPGFFAAYRSWVDKHPQTALNYFKAIQEANKLTAEDFPKASQLARKFFAKNGVDFEQDVADVMLRNVDPTTFFLPDMNQYLTKSTQPLIDDGTLKEMPDWNKVLLPKYAEQAAAEIGVKNTLKP